jgi:diacylglycerol kinase (ATP)
MSNKFRSPGYHPIQKLKVILAGLDVAVVTDFSVAYKVILSVPILGGAFFFRQWVDVSLILLAMGLMLIAELFNSAIEVLCDFVEPQQNDRAGSHAFVPGQLRFCHGHSAVAVASPNRGCLEADFE